MAGGILPEDSHASVTREHDFEQLFSFDRAKAKDKAWQEEYFQKILPIQSQENMALSRYFPWIEQKFGLAWQLTRHGRRNTSRRFYPCFRHKRT
jgi:predicted 3-demethylubiquinone-9 3-methyltransferase (glyoxalase superfamily)